MECLIYRVTLFDKTTLDAKVVGHDQGTDLAVLHIDAPNHKLRSIPVGVSANLRIGQKVYAIGHPVSVILVMAFKSQRLVIFFYRLVEISFLSSYLSLQLGRKFTCTAGIIR